MLQEFQSRGGEVSMPNGRSLTDDDTIDLQKLLAALKSGKHHSITGTCSLK